MDRDVATVLGVVGALGLLAASPRVVDALLGLWSLPGFVPIAVVSLVCWFAFTRRRASATPRA